MFGVVIVMKKYLYGFQATSSSLVSVDVIGQRVSAEAIGRRRKVLNKIFILGMSEEGMTTLGEIEDADILHWIDTNMVESKEEPDSWRREEKMRRRGLVRLRITLPGT